MTTLLGEMDIPDEVVRVAYDTIKAFPSYSRNGVEAAIRAALQAMVDGGMAETGNVAFFGGGTIATPCLVIRLTSDERKREET